MIETPDRLTELKKQINDLAAQINADWCRGFDHMTTCGHRLAEARRLVPKGQWF